ncbi:MAG: 50S ribosomal protein L4 [Spirochaetaceae bacterium]|jgi:large subunit ribosomal protein L4|nr:50S ribosomal protein L4 [Spirochaetaceae bacterium]GMO17837.1 MAG: 50S ribosomal protein L4 [Termitinemataceae bacterium]
MKGTLYSTKGEEIKKIELDDAVFGLPVNEDVIWYAINNELANRRLGTACSKDRGEVHGSNAKPYKQKGTGRARRGDKKSPLLVGGGVVFGPKPRDFSFSIPKKAKRLALKTILSLKAQSETLSLIEDFNIESGKTRDLAAILQNFGKPERTIIILDDNKTQESLEKNRLIKRAGRNIPNVYFLSYDSLSAHTLFYGRKVLMQESVAGKLSGFYGEARK